MAAVVDACIGELAKLKERVRARNLFSFKVQKTEVAEEEEARGTKLTKQISSSLKSSCKDEDDSSLSEATVCLLMDRFCPL